jgi:hypothetical protein
MCFWEHMGQVRQARQNQFLCLDFTFPDISLSIT